ncbi:hypothetical protein M413DRAFT_260623 [Hebeloma cylindrosporum]|uniref:Uncharacterized protein n=1 Tax=Hebeloma cylindrosporum TaxID=76867 RepID=A0A0C3CD28_HEBCY|nr:hypothetical protein M413DRAFT_260623 [Hebeloma cylindrosporum h7]
MNAEFDPFILKLPPEIASHIFLLVVGKQDISALRHRGAGGLPTPYLCSAVCAGWRQLARSTPNLWSLLTFKFSDFANSTTMEALPHLITDWLERSGSLPLTLKVGYSRHESR